MHHRTRRLRSLTVFAALTLAVAACGGSDDSASDDTEPETTETTEAPEETTTTAPTKTTQTTEEAPDDGEIPGGSMMLGDKTILLDGFFGVEIPAGWSVTSAEVPMPSSAPPGETELDPDALRQALVINPDAAPRDATFSLVHYQHSDAVPDLAAFDEAIVGLLSGDGSTITEGQGSSIGGQESVLHQVQSAQGQTGLLVSLVTGGEYFFIISLIGDPSYSSDTANMLTTSSFVPEVLFG